MPQPFLQGFESENLRSGCVFMLFDKMAWKFKSVIVAASRFYWSAYRDERYKACSIPWKMGKIKQKNADILNVLRTFSLWPAPRT